jgi:hypothetical protein
MRMAERAGARARWNSLLTVRVLERGKGETMGANYLILAAAAAACALSCGPVWAGRVIGVQLQSGDTKTDAISSTNLVAGVTFPETAPGAFGGFSINNVSGIDTGGKTGINIGSTDLNVLSKAGVPLMVYISESSIDLFKGKDVKFTVNFY